MLGLPIELLLTVAVMLLAVYLFVTEKLRVDVVALLVMTSLLVLGIISVPEALSGFSNQATVMVAAMFVLSGALKANGALVAIGDLLSRIRWRWLFLLVMLALGVSTAAFINNTATVAVFLPLVLVAAAANGWAPSKFLIPLSYISQTAGVCTLIGTSTNLLVDSMAREQAGVGFTIFEFAPLGIIFVGICAVYLLTVGWWILPNRGTPSPGETEHVGRFIAEVVVPPDAPVIGESAREALPDNIEDVDLLEVLRNGVPVRGADATIAAGDRLLLRGNWPRIDAARKAMKCRFDRVPKAPERAPVRTGDGEDNGEKAKEKDAPRKDERLHVEAMVAPGSHLIGRTLFGMRFAHTYRSRVQGIHRRQLSIRSPLDRVTLSVGDVLMLDAPADAVEDLRADPGMIVLGERAQQRVAPKRAIVSALIMFAAIGVAALGWLPIVASALVGCLALVALRLMTPDEAYESIDWQVILLLAGIIPLGLALQKTGGASMVADLLLNVLGPYGPVATLAAIYLMTSVLTEMMSNNASAVLVVPIALATAESMGVDAKPLLIAVAFAASTSFATPISYQTNTMVYTAGGYRFSDFVKVGMPLNVIFWISAIILIPRFFPFYPGAPA
ncbi:MAG: SLC13 family permease [Luteimonas sp.]